MQKNMQRLMPTCRICPLTENIKKNKEDDDDIDDYDTYKYIDLITCCHYYTMQMPNLKHIP